MKLRISASSLLANHYLDVRSDGVKFCETAGIGSGTKHFKFHQIECVLMGTDGRLSFQVGQEVFSIPTKPEDSKHQAVIAALVRQVEQANGRNPANA